MFHVAPLLVALVVWLARRLPRRAGCAVAVVVPAALLVTIPLESLLTISLLSDSFALIPLLRLTQRLDGGAQDVRVLLGLGLVGAALLFAALPRRWSAILVPLSVIGFLLVSSVATFRTIRFPLCSGPGHGGALGRLLGRSRHRNGASSGVPLHARDCQSAHALADGVLEPGDRADLPGADRRARESGQPFDGRPADRPGSGCRSQRPVPAGVCSRRCRRSGRRQRRRPRRCARVEPRSSAASRGGAHRRCVRRRLDGLRRRVQLLCLAGGRASPRASHHGVVVPDGWALTSGLAFGSGSGDSGRLTRGQPRWALRRSSGHG